MADLQTQIGFEQIGLASVLKQFQLHIPSHQREYSWTESEVTMLFQDLAKAITEDEPSYFLGTIVTIPQDAGSLEVVDGQQRLATTAILLAAIRDYLQEHEAMIAESINNEFLTGIDRQRRERVPRLSLNLDDNEFFRSHLASEGGADLVPATKPSHRLIQGAFELAQGHVSRIVSSLDIKDHGNALNRWIQFMEHGALVILLRVPTGANAFKMFETLNDRGLKTSQADLVKSYLFGCSGDRLPEAQQKWALMRGTLDTLDDDDITITFLRHALIALQGYLRESHVYDVVQQQARGIQSAITFTNTLELMAGNYIALFNPEHEKWNTYPDSLSRALEVLNLFNIRPLQPLMLAVATKFSQQEAASSFQMFISWAVRLLIAGTTRSGSVEHPLAAAAHEVFTEQITDSSSLKARIADVIPVDEQFKSAFEIATVSKAVLARYYLRSLEMAAKQETEPWFFPNEDRQTINLEHVLPQKPEGNWPNFDEESVGLYVKRVGNMALLQARSNSDLRSVEFSAKREIYAQSPYVLTSQIAEVEQWGPEQISERQKILAEIALVAWPA